MFTICERGEIVNRGERVKIPGYQNVNKCFYNYLFYKFSIKAILRVTSLTIRVTGPIVHKSEVFTRRERL